MKDQQPALVHHWTVGGVSFTGDAKLVLEKLEPGVHTVALFVTAKDQPGREASKLTSVELTVLAEKVPTVALTCESATPLASAPFVCAGSVKAADGEIYEFSIASGVLVGGVSLEAAAMTSTEGVVTPNAFFIKLDANVLTPGGSYAFALTVGSERAVVSVVANGSPTGGIISAELASEADGRAHYTLRQDYWVDDQLPLTHSFASRVEDEEAKLGGFAPPAQMSNAWLGSPGAAEAVSFARDALGAVARTSIDVVIPVTSASDDDIEGWLAMANATGDLEGRLAAIRGGIDAVGDVGGCRRRLAASNSGTCVIDGDCGPGVCVDAACRCPLPSSYGEGRFGARCSYNRTAWARRVALQASFLDTLTATTLSQVPDAQNADAQAAAIQRVAVASDAALFADPALAMQTATAAGTCAATGASVGSDASTPSRLAAGLGAALVGLPAAYGDKLSKHLDALVGANLQGAVDCERALAIEQAGLNLTSQRLSSTLAANATLTAGGTSATLGGACDVGGSIDASVAVLGSYPRGGPRDGSLASAVTRFGASTDDLQTAALGRARRAYTRPWPSWARATPLPPALLQKMDCADDQRWSYSDKPWKTCRYVGEKIKQDGSLARCTHKNMDDLGRSPLQMCPRICGTCGGRRRLAACQNSVSLELPGPNPPSEVDPPARLMQGNLAGTYKKIGRLEAALRMRQDVYSGFIELFGKEHEGSLMEASNYANDLINLRRFEEAKSMLRKTMPVARRVFGDSHDRTLQMRWAYAIALCNTSTTLDDFREAVNTLEDVARTARRVLGAAHPDVVVIEDQLRKSRAALQAHETQPPRKAQKDSSK